MAERIPVFWDFNNIKLKQAQRELDRTRVKTRQLQGSANLLSKSFKNLGTTLLATFGAIAVLNAFRNILKSLKDLEFQMSKVAAISGATSKQMIELRNNAIKVGAASKFTATEVGKLQEELARLGFTTTEILKLTDSISALAIVADRELGPTALAVAKTINAFSLSAADAERVVNVMAESFANSALDLEKFDAAMRNVGTAAVATGFSLEKTTAIIAILVDNGIEASKAGTDLRRVLVENAKAGRTLEESLDLITLSTEKVTTATDLFKQRAFLAGIVLANNTEQLKVLEDQFSDTTREIDRMRRLMEDNLETDLKKMASAFDALIQKGSNLNNVFRVIVQSLTELTRGNFTAVAVARDRLRQLTEEIEKQNELDETLRRVTSTVKQAFDSGNIEGFIKALENNINKEEIIVQIRRIQKEETQVLRIEEEKLKKQRESEIRSISNLKEEISELNEIRNTAAPRQIRQITQRIELLKEELRLLKEIGIRAKPDIEAEKEINKIKQEGLKTVDLELANIKKILDASEAKSKRLGELAEAALQQNKAVQQAIFDSGASILNGLFNLRQTNLSNDLRSLETQKNNQLRLAGESVEERARIESDFEERKNTILTKRAQSEKTQAIVNIAIDTAQNAVKLFAATIPPGILSAIAIAFGAAQAALVLAQPLPKFKEGVIDYQGEGTTTSDSNIVKISKGESIIKASATAKSKELLESINSGRLNDELSEILLNNKIGNADSGELLAAMVGVNSSIKGLPIHQTYITERGIARYIQKENSRVRLLRNKYING